MTPIESSGLMLGLTSDFDSQILAKYLDAGIIISSVRLNESSTIDMNFDFNKETKQFIGNNTAMNISSVLPFSFIVNSSETDCLIKDVDGLKNVEFKDASGQLKNILDPFCPDFD